MAESRTGGRFSPAFPGLLSHFPDKLAASQVLLYLLASFFGFLLTVPLGITLRNFHGGCILFAQIVWDNTEIYPWMQQTCDFVLYTNLAINVFYGTLMGLFMLAAVWPRTDSSQFNKVGAIMQWNLKHMVLGVSPVMTVITMVIIGLELTSAVLLTSGLSKFCSWLMESMAEKGTELKTCAAGQGIDWMQFRIRNGYTHGVYGNSFYTCLVLSSVSAWALLVIWTLQLVIYSYRSCNCCSWEIAEEKRKPDRSWLIAQRRSRMATPIGTPGGRHAPVQYGQPMPHPTQIPLLSSAGYGPPQSAGYGPPQSAGYDPPQSAGYDPPQSAGYGPPQSAGYGPPQSAGYGPPQSAGTTKPPGPQQQTTPPPGPQQLTTLPPGQQQLTTPPLGPQQLATPPPGPQQLTTLPPGPQQLKTPPAGPQQLTTPPPGQQQLTTPPPGPQQLITQPPGPQH
ncbi:hypothetical protein LSAT2_010132 [Lamellibrachia satsuma]|nr:hypothetical protein LSAT2_010132 [Lamellibrachia satsuma]